MHKTTWKGLALSGLLSTLILAGCGRRANVLTAGHRGRRVGNFDVEGNWIAYTWYPASHMSTRGHLVLFDTAEYEETVLDDDVSGPMAMDNGRVVWWNGRLRDEEGKSDLLVYDVRRKTLETIAHEKVGHLDVDGDYVVWEEEYEAGSDIVLCNLASAKRRTISSGGRDGDMMNRDPRIGDGVVAWEAYNRQTRASAIVAYDIAGEQTTEIDLPQARPRLSVSGGRIVYVLKKGDLREIHLHDIAGGSDKVISSPKRLVTPPYIEGDKVVWCEHITSEDFNGIPGQPLMDERDIRDVFLYDINSGRKHKVAEALLSVGGRPAVHDGRVYLQVYREYPPPGASNLIVSVDLWVW